MARQLVWVFLAGGLGATLRITLAAGIDDRWGQHLPFVGTLAVNMLGCFAIGAAAAVLPTGASRTVVLGGLLGGFTTYSAFALLSQQLLRDGRIGVLTTQVCAHLIAGMVCVAGGAALGRMLSTGPTT